MEYFGAAFVKREVNEILGMCGLNQNDRVGNVVYLVFLCAFLVIVFLTIITLYKSAFPSDKAFAVAATSTPQTNAPCSIATEGQSGGINRVECDGAPAIYAWTNKDTWNSEKTTRGYKTDLRFNATGGSLPHQVCFSIQMNTPFSLFDVSRGGGRATFGFTDNKNRYCFHNPYRSEILSVITESQPIKIEAALISVE